MVEPTFWSYFWIIIILGGLLAGLYIVRVYGFKVPSLNNSGNIQLLEYFNIGDGAKAVLLKTHGKSFLCVVTRNGCSSLVRVDSHTDSES